MRPQISTVLRAVSFTFLAKKTGHTRTHVRRALQGMNGCSLTLAAKIANTLNISIDEVYWHIEAMRAEHRAESFAAATGQIAESFKRPEPPAKKKRKGSK